MRNKVLTFLAGYILLLPCFLGLCTESIGYIVFAGLYAIILWFSPKYDNRIKVFWRKFLRIVLEISRVR